MDVFISWSGERSRAAAEALRGWLPKIINAIKPWLSSADIDKGARWSTDVASRLEGAKAGIICLTPSNLHSDWILFEAGALSKTFQNTYVCPFLIGLEPSDVKPPLAQFQATKAEKDDVLKLLKTLNSALGDNALPETHIEEAFDVWWPKLDSQLKNLPLEKTHVIPHRSERDLLEEVLSLVRNQNRPNAAYSYIDGDVLDRLIFKIVQSFDEEINQMTVSVLRGNRRYTFAAEDAKRRFSIVLPQSGNLDLLEAIALSQLNKQKAVMVGASRNKILPVARNAAPRAAKKKS